ncbi:MAG: glycosyltransferase family 4 protein [Bacteroidota bacterium]|nr:glycosyltransferase family 4 protein [Bacteroidota bacterium]
MKILVLNWQDITNPLAGGAEVHLHEVFERIARRGHDVTLFCHRYRGSSREELRNGIRIIRQGGRFLFNYLVPIRYLLKFRKEHFDVVIDDINKIPFFTPLFVREPIIAVTHHLFGRSIFLEAIFPFAFYIFLFERLIKPVYRNVPFIVGSPSTYREYTEWGFRRDQVTIINYCVNKEIYYPSLNDEHEPYRICYFGRLKRYKSIDHLLEACSLLRKDYPELTLDIIGDGDDRTRLENVTKKLDLRDQVHFHGFIDEKKKAPLLHKMRFAVQPSSKEGWGLTVIEANACGVPVIAADVPGLRDSVKNNVTGILYPYGNIESLASAMRILLDDADLRRKMSVNAREWANSFDWAIAAEKTLEIIHEHVQHISRESFRKSMK